MTYTRRHHNLVSLAASTLIALAFAACAEGTPERPGGDEDDGDGVACNPGQDLCGETCLDLSNDPKNCGACDQACDAASACVNGACVACANGQAACDNVCVDLAKDAANCGACGTACGDTQACVDFACGCAAPEMDCNGTCIDTQMDPANCGGCEVACNEGEVCLAGSCELDCGTLTECNGSCRDLKTDAEACGSCTNVCTPGYECNNSVCECDGAVCGACGATTLTGTLPLLDDDSTSGADMMQGTCSSSEGPEKGYLFTAPSAGTYVFDTFGSSFDTVIYLRDAGSSCDELACDDDTNGTQSQVITSLAAGQEVVVIVDGWLSSSMGTFTLNVQEAPACPGNTLTGALPIMVSGDTNTGSEVYTNSCNYSGGKELSYAFTAPADGGYVFEATGTAADTSIGIYDGSCGESDELACNEDFSTNNAKVGVYLAANQTVNVLVEAAGTEGTFDLSVSQGPACPGADAGNSYPQQLTGNTSTAENFTEPSACGGGAAGEVSYEFTATTAGDYTFDTIGSGFDTVIYVRDAVCGGAEIDCDDDGAAPQSTVTVTLAANQTVVVFVDGYFSTSSGEYKLNVAGP